jgi:transcriptional regulator with XRE-family HTH domain
MLSAMTDDIRTQRDVDPVRKQIGDNVRAELARLGLRHDDLAKVLGISQPQVTKRLAGTIGFEGAELVRIAAELNIPVSRLVEAPAPASAA